MTRRQPEYWEEAKAHLARQCPTMKTLIERYEGETLAARGNGFYTLLRSVVGQQISVKAADAVWAKVEAAVKPLTPKKLLTLSDEELRACGLSRSKILYARNVAEFFLLHGSEPEYWHTHSDQEVISALTSIKGIGTWTAEMFLIFHLMRPDIFPIQDLGVLKAIDLHYAPKKRAGTAAKRNIDKYHKLARKWQPYRTVASWYLWRSLDPLPVEY